jgi:hypothetical protein
MVWKSPGVGLSSFLPCPEASLRGGLRLVFRLAQPFVNMPHDAIMEHDAVTGMIAAFLQPRCKP